MKCSEAHSAMLEAELPSLEGAGDDPLALHISGCLACAEKARAIIQAETSLANALEEAVPSPNLERVLQTAGVGGTPGAFPSSPARRFPRGLRARFTLLPLAAAAVLAALFLGRPPALPGPPYSPPRLSAGLDVQVPEGTDVAVLKTNNPAITVLWLY
jgi:hypothetical protein